MKRICFAIAFAIVTSACVGPAGAETIAVFTKNRTSPISVALRAGASMAAKNLGVQVVHYVPSTPDSVEQQVALVEDTVKTKPDAIVFVPVHFDALAPAARAPELIEKLDAVAGRVLKGKTQ